MAYLCVNAHNRMWIPENQMSVISYPTACHSFGVLPFAVVCHTCNDKKQQALPSWLNSHNVKHKVLFDPAEANHFLPWRFGLCCFPLELKRQPSRYQNFEAQSHSLFSRCLRLATIITDSHPRLATGGWLDLTRQAFHLLDYSPLSGRTIPICLFPYHSPHTYISSTAPSAGCFLPLAVKPCFS